MKSISVTTARKDLYRLVSDVNLSGSPVMITNSKGKNAVLISEDDWNSIWETLYLNSVPGMVQSIQEAREEPISGSTIYHPGEEW